MLIVMMMAAMVMGFMGCDNGSTGSVNGGNNYTTPAEFNFVGTWDSLHLEGSPDNFPVAHTVTLTINADNTWSATWTNGSESGTWFIPPQSSAHRFLVRTEPEGGNTSGNLAHRYQIANFDQVDRFRLIFMGNPLTNIAFGINFAPAGSPGNLRTAMIFERRSEVIY